MTSELIIAKIQNHFEAVLNLKLECKIITVTKDKIEFFCGDVCLVSIVDGVATCKIILKEKFFPFKYSVTVKEIMFSRNYDGDVVDGGIMMLKYFSQLNSFINFVLFVPKSLEFGIDIFNLKHEYEKLGYFFVVS